MSTQLTQVIVNFYRRFREWWLDHWRQVGDWAFLILAILAFLWGMLQWSGVLTP